MKALKSVLYSMVVVLGLSSTGSAAALFQVPQETLYVKETGAATNSCLSWDDACDMHTAITKLPYKIYVAEGTYFPSLSDRNASFNLVSGLQIFGGFPADGGTWEERDWQEHETILSGDIDGDGTLENNSIHVLTATDVNHLARLDGFTIMGGNADLMESLITSSGAGMYNSNSNPTLSNLKFIGNSATRGAGMYNDASSPTLSNVIFSQNSADYGGGMYNDQSNPTLTTVTFSANLSSNLVGVMYNIDSSPTLTDVTFTDNVGGGMYNEHGSPTLNYVLFFANISNQGGGMRNQGGGSPILTNVSFIGNTANRGGGLANVYSSPTLFNVTFFDNRAIDASSLSGLGGGMANYNSSPELTNITFSANTSSGHGGGVYNEQSSNPLLTNVTFTGNTAAISGGGVANFGANPESMPSNPVITNTIFWANSPDQIFNSGNSSASVSYSVIQGGCPTGVTCDVIITGDPLLGPLADNGGFTQTHALLPGSSAIDKGNSDPAVCPGTDQRGYTRPIGAGCDIGAYEYGYTLDVLTEGNGSVFIDPDKSEYNLDEQVALTATADPGWTFTGWSGNATVTDNIVTITKETNLTATFTQDEYTLTVMVDPENSGIVTYDPPQGPYHYGEVVTLTPTANTGYAFESWSGAEVKDNTVTITGDTTVTANFTQDEQGIYLPLILR